MCQPWRVTDGSRKAIIAAFFANLGIALAKFVGFLLTSSAGLLAEAAHSLADTGNQGLLLLGGKRARREADVEHPFGYGRERYFWAFVVALVLFSMGGLFALYEGISKVRHPHETENLYIAVGILLFAIALESYSLRTAVKESQHVKPKSMGWWKFIRTAKQPELPVVLLEDIGAEIGLFFALCGVLIADGDRRPAVGRRRVDRDRLAARDDRHRAGDRDQGLADRRVGRHRRTRSDRRRHRGRRARRAPDPPPYGAPRAGRDPRRGQGGVRHRPHVHRAGGRDRRRRSPDPRGRADRPA